MSIRTITVVQYPSMPGRFKIKGSMQGQCRDSSDAGEAAAVALNYAANTPGNWIIVGCKEVLQHIPESLRSRL